VMAALVLIWREWAADEATGTVATSPNVGPE
jgi:hypothetical protein